MVLSEVLNELSTTTLFVERERGDVEFDSIRAFALISVTKLNVNLTILSTQIPAVLVFAFFLISCIIEGSIAGEESGS